MSIIWQKSVKTRKPHMCHGCWTKYESGNQMEVTTEDLDNKLTSIYWCQICVEFMKILDPYDLYEIGSGDFWEYDHYKDFRNNKLNDG